MTLQESSQIIVDVLAANNSTTDVIYPTSKMVQFIVTLNDYLQMNDNVTVRELREWIKKWHEQWSE